MLAVKILDKGKVLLSETSSKQYEIVCKEVDKLCELSNMKWGLIKESYFDNVVKTTLCEGIVYGLLIGYTLNIVNNKIAKRKGKS